MEETVVVSLSVPITVEGAFRNVKELEDQLIEAVHEAARAAYVESAAQYQENWLEAHREQYEPVRWRQRDLLSPFGLLGLPNRVIRKRGEQSGGYLSLGKLLWSGKATGLLSPRMERAALEAATIVSYRQAARQLEALSGESLSHWSVWRCVQYWGQKLQEHRARDWWVEQPLGVDTDVVITEMDSVHLKRQHRGPEKGSKHFQMHLGVSYTGRERRWEKRGSLSVKLQNKTLLVGTERLAVFGRRLRRHRDRNYGMKVKHQVVVSDGDEGLERVREREFEEATWLLDRWHVAHRVRGLVGEDQEAYNHILKSVYRSDSEGALRALAACRSRLPEKKLKEFNEVFGYVLGNREGIDAFKELPASLRQSHGRKLAPVKAGSGVAEKNIETNINRRFKGQGRSWNPDRADRLMQLKALQSDPAAWDRWWDRLCLSRVRVNPGLGTN